jgi:signal transduction histidine kinase
VSRIGPLARTYAFDAFIAVLVLSAMIEVAVRDSPNAPQTTLWFCLPAIAVMVLPLFVRRRMPFAAPAAYWLLAASYSFVDGRLVTFPRGLYVLGIATAFMLGNLRDTTRARVGLGVVGVCSVIVVYNLPDRTAAEQVFIPLVFVISWVAGFALRERVEQAEAAEVRAERAEREREAAARIAVAEERARIARELHDIVAHAVSVMVLQVGAVRHNLPESLDADAEALEGVERTGRTALTEMRRLLGAMRDEGDDVELGPQPGLGELEPLVEEVGRAGVPVHVHVDGDPFALPRAIELSAYRVVQEGLTNVLKHAGASRADVTLRYSPEELTIEVRDDGDGRGAADGLGHGLVGVRERVKIYGGEMSAAAAPEGGFVLSTRFPLGGEGS